MTKKKKLMIIGAGGHAKVCIDIAEKMNRWEIIELLDDNSKINNLLNKNIIGELNQAYKYIDSHEFIVAIGNNGVRHQIFDTIRSQKGIFTKLIDPSAQISSYSEIENGTVVMPNVVINADAKIGYNCIINSSSIIEHDCVLGNHVHISPAVVLAGNVLISSQSWIGSNSVVKENTQITYNVIVGAGSFVRNSIIKKGTYYGVI